MRILIVEDDPDVQELLCVEFEKRRCQVDTALCVRDALGHLTGQDYDWMILDHHLPDGTGLDILDLIDLPSTRVVLYTGNAEYPRLHMQSILRGLAGAVQKTKPVSDLVNLVCPQNHPSGR